MFRSRILLVVGAGASTEAGLPAGAGLAEVISSKLNIEFDELGESLQSGDRAITSALRTLGRQNFSSLIGAARQISGGLPFASSIDSFMDLHKDDKNIQSVGKIAIVQSILEAEQHSHLYVKRRSDRTLDGGRLKKTWLGKFFELLSTEVEKSKIETLFDQVSMITFNYDRCIEHFLAYAIMAAYGLAEADAFKILAKLKIFHPYGYLGLLPGQGAARTRAHDFGSKEAGPEDLIELSKGIRTYSERIEDEDALNALWNEISQAEIVIFLGFAFHQQNMRLLTPSAATARPHRRGRGFATAFGMSEQDGAIVHHQIEKLLEASRKNAGIAVQVCTGITCVKLFEDYGRTFLMG